MAGSVGRSVALRSETGSGTVLMTGIISALLIMAGHISLALIPNVVGLAIGLICIAIGSGGLKTNASVLVGSPSYSIKKLEPLYMGEERRDDDGVTGGGDSIVEYHRYAQAVIDGDQTLADKRLEDIRQYNEYDCLSTLRLRDWLLARATEAGVEPTPSRADADPGPARRHPG